MQLDPYAQMPKKLMLIRAISGTIKGIQQMPNIWLVMLTNAQYSVLLWWSLKLLFVRVGRLFPPLLAPVFPDYLLFSVGVIALWNWTPVQIEGHCCRGNRAEAVIAPPAMQIPVKQDRAIKVWRRLLDKSGTFTRKAWGGKKWMCDVLKEVLLEAERFLVASRVDIWIN